MVAFAFAHLFIMHYQRAPSATDAAFVAGRWTGLAWRAFDGVLLLLALTHGVAGAYGTVRARVRPGAPRAALAAAFAVGLGAFASLGLWTLLAGARTAGSAAGPLSGAAWIPAAALAALAGLAALTYAAGLAAAILVCARLVRRLPLGRWVYPGQWAFALSRAAGVGVLGFLCVHILDIALVPLAPNLYDRTVRGYAAPFLVPMEAALVAAVVYHALNGLRLMTLEALDARAERAHTPVVCARPDRDRPARAPEPGRPARVSTLSRRHAATDRR